MDAIGRVLFDEAHSEAWSVSHDKAHEIQSRNPDDSSYSKAGEIAKHCGLVVERHVDGKFTKSTLENTDLLVIAQPSDSLWEKTTGVGSPIFDELEIDTMLNFMEAGGYIIVITEHDYLKYGSNIHVVLQKVGIGIVNETVYNSDHCKNDNPSWVYFDSSDTCQDYTITGLVNSACFYRSGSCVVDGGSSKIVLRTSSQSDSKEGLIAQARYGNGGIISVCDSDIFGNMYIEYEDNGKLWENILLCAANGAFKKYSIENDVEDINDILFVFDKLKLEVEKLRILQSEDGSIHECDQSQANLIVSNILVDLGQSRPLFPHQDEYFEALQRDFFNWIEHGFIKPNWCESIEAWNPQIDRTHGRIHLVLLPVYLPNASTDVKFEAALIQEKWPDWLAQIESESYKNPAFVPGNLLSYTSGYKSECAVLFPEMVSVENSVDNHFGIIFCDRESSRMISCLHSAVQILKMKTPAKMTALMSSNRLAMNSYMLWDMLHDCYHQRGYLPFDPFIVRKRLPYWMYSVEELRVDLASYRTMIEMEKQFPLAEYVKYSIIFDRIFRFPITGSRIRNYDSLAGQLIFGKLYSGGAVEWIDREFVVHWEKLDNELLELESMVSNLYKLGPDLPVESHWNNVHKFISKYVEPTHKSKWVRYFCGSYDMSVFDSVEDIRTLADDDEFPLNQFYSFLKGRMGCIREHGHL